MLEFKKYNSIENSFSREFMEKVVAEMPADLKYVEKRCMAPTSSSSVVEEIAKRTDVNNCLLIFLPRLRHPRA